MSEFFQGWRRKTGVATLVMALIFIGVWIRGLGTFDVINCPLGHEYAIAITSWKNAFAVRIGWDNEDSWDEFVWRASDDDYFGCTDPNYPIEGLYRFDEPIPDGSGCIVSWYLLGDCGGIGVTPLDQRSYRRMLFMIVPYWSTVIPFTLISGYLLLSRPGKPVTTKTAESTPATGS